MYIYYQSCRCGFWSPGFDKRSISGSTVANYTIFWFLLYYIGTHCKKWHTTISISTLIRSRNFYNIYWDGAYSLSSLWPCLSYILINAGFTQCYGVGGGKLILLLLFFIYVVGCRCRVMFNWWASFPLLIIWFMYNYNHWKQ